MTHNPTVAWHSTRNPTTLLTTSEAMLAGLAPDGGLLMPQHLPLIDPLQFTAMQDYPKFAARLLQPFFAGDILESELLAICEEAFQFPVPLKVLNQHTSILELFHGPTLAFKDFGARFLAACFTRLQQSTKPILILVATSGDTGSAVASAFHGKAGMRVSVLYPYQKISPRQQAQITCFGDNILALAVEGRFDDCQYLVKAAFADARFREHWHLSTANSINVGRLLPQMVYYAYTSMVRQKQGYASTNFIVPTGNCGNVTAAYLAKAMGFPIGRIHLALNANHVIADYCQTGYFNPQPSIATLANAMDVGNPSNFERLHYLFPTHDAFTAAVSTTVVNDNEIRQAILTCSAHDVFLCPHTATAYHARLQLPQTEDWVIVATAHPSKFESIIEPIIGKALPIPERLQSMLNSAKPDVIIHATLDALQAKILA